MAARRAHGLPGGSGRPAGRVSRRGPGAAEGVNPYSGRGHLPPCEPAGHAGGPLPGAPPRTPARDRRKPTTAGATLARFLGSGGPAATRQKGILTTMCASSQVARNPASLRRAMVLNGVRALLGRARGASRSGGSEAATFATALTGQCVPREDLGTPQEGKGCTKE
jgi:hypothetical protein